MQQQNPPVFLHLHYITLGLSSSLILFLGANEWLGHMRKQDDRRSVKHVTLK